MQHFRFQSSKIKKGTQGDVSVLKPTLMAAVPVSCKLELPFLASETLLISVTVCNVINFTLDKENNR